MVDFLPEIVEAEPEPEPLVVEKPIEEEKEDDPLDEKLNLEQEDEIPQEEIFKKQDPPVVLQVEGTEEKIKEILEEDEPKATPKPKKKRVASQKQREALARTRAKRAEIVKKRQEVKKLAEEEAKKIMKKNRVKELKEELRDELPPINVEDAVLQGIQKYETIRKQRKEEKRIKRQKEKEEEEQKKKIEVVKKTVQHAVNGGYKPEKDVYADCFNFSY